MIHAYLTKTNAGPRLANRDVGFSQGLRYDIVMHMGSADDLPSFWTVFEFFVLVLDRKRKSPLTDAAERELYGHSIGRVWLAIDVL
jgi:hypothetical protein